MRAFVAIAFGLIVFSSLSVFADNCSFAANWTKVKKSGNYFCTSDRTYYCDHTFEKPTLLKGDDENTADPASLCNNMVPLTRNVCVALYGAAQMYGWKNTPKSHITCPDARKGNKSKN